MDHNKDTRYARWLSGELTDDEQEQLKESEELADLEAIIGAIDQLKPPKYNAEAAYGQFKKKQPKPSAKVHTLNIRLFMGVAASLAILIVAFTFWNSRPVVTTAPLANTSMHLLPDQSNVLLNDGSSIEYKKNNWEQERKVHLLGEAFFKVQKGAKFQIETANGTVAVLGTQFNVRAWGNKLHVECYEGSVKVTSQQQETILSATQAVNMVNGRMQEKQTIKHQTPLWSAGNSQFYEENINQVFAELERQYAVKVNAPVLKRSFNGTFPHDNLESALKAICKPMQLQYGIGENGTLVTITN